jgi:fatty-acyl-CoA synthase
MDDIVDGVVVGRADEKWGEVPVAVVILKQGASLTEAEFLGRFQDQLARFKHPKAAIFVDDLPRNAMGKVLKYEVREMVAE